TWHRRAPRKPAPKPRTPTGQSARPRRPEPACSRGHGLPAAHDYRVRAAAAHHPAVHPLPAQPGRVLGQPRQRPDRTPPLVPVLLPEPGPRLLSRPAVRQLALCQRKHAATARRPPRSPLLSTAARSCLWYAHVAPTTGVSGDADDRRAQDRRSRDRRATRRWQPLVPPDPRLLHAPAAGQRG